MLAPLKKGWYHIVNIIFICILVFLEGRDVIRLLHMRKKKLLMRHSFTSYLYKSNKHLTSSRFPNDISLCVLMKFRMYVSTCLHISVSEVQVNFCRFGCLKSIHHWGWWWNMFCRDLNLQKRRNNSEKNVRFVKECKGCPCFYVFHILTLKKQNRYCKYKKAYFKCKTSALRFSTKNRYFLTIKMYFFCTFGLKIWK